MISVKAHASDLVRKKYDDAVTALFMANFKHQQPGDREGQTNSSKLWVIVYITTNGTQPPQPSKPKRKESTSPTQNDPPTQHIHATSHEGFRLRSVGIVQVSAG